MFHFAGNLLTLTFLLLSATARSQVSVKAVPGESYLAEALGLLDSAKQNCESIDLLHFSFFTESGSIRRLAENLIKVRKSCPEIPIRVLLEGEKDANKPNGIAARNAMTKKKLETSDISVSLISGLRNGEVNGVTHAKMLRVGNKVLAGSTNLSNTSVDKNNEFNLLVDSKTIADAAKKYVTSLEKNWKRLYEISASDDTVTILTDTIFFERALETIRLASVGESLELFTYFFAYRSEADVKAKEILQALLDANARGAAIVVYLERSQNEELNSSITEANFKVAKQLAEGGIRTVYLDPPDKISHSKIINYIGKTESRLLVGSTNLFRGDLDENHQVNWLVTDPKLSGAVSAYLKQKLAYEATRYETLQSETDAPRMIRFWRGYAQDRKNLESFRKAVNEKLIPETTAVGARRGLDAYLPAFPPVKSTAVPDEVALLVYRTDETYNAIRSTPRGREYGPLHFADGMFAKVAEDGLKSESRLVKKFDGQIEVPSAVLIGPPSTNWQTGHTEMRLSLDVRNALNVAKRLQTLQEEKQIQAAVLVAEAGYTMTLINCASKAKCDHAITKAAITEQTPIPFEIQNDGKTDLKPGAGISVRFPTEWLEPRELLKPVLQELGTN